MKTKVAFKMKLKPGFKNEYKRRHNEIWTEFKELLKESGISNYNIFIDEETNDLFAVQEVADKGSQDISTHPVIKKWWAYIADIMETNEDCSPMTRTLQEVFYLE